MSHRNDPLKPVNLLLERLEGVEQRNGFYRAFCSAHDDRNTPNLDLKEGDDGRALVICRAGCDTEAIVSALGLKMRDLFAGDGHRGGKTDTPRATAHACTLEAYAGAKGLPVGFLRRLGLSDFRYAGSPAVRIPYRDVGGVEVAVRFRLALEKGVEGDDRFRWRRGDKALPYGLWRLNRAREAGYVVLVEGESDCHTLWHHGVHALGIPGACSWKEEWSVHLDGIPKVYAVVEPDEGGEALKEKLVLTSVRERLRFVALDGTKDVSELHLSDPDRFKENLRVAFGRAVPWADEERAKAKARIRESWEACEALAREPRVLDRFAADLRRSGLAGEDRAATLLYLALTSRLLDRIVSVAVKGPSSSGKTYLVERVLDFFPEDAYHALTAMSERTLAYSEEPIRHRFLVIYEAEGFSGNFATYLMRSLLSEGKVRYETVESTPQGIKPRLIEREGPTGLIVTTTAVRLHPENETRLLSLTVTDTRNQTKDVLRALARGAKEPPNLAPWRALQAWLGSPDACRRVAIPYAEDLAELVPPVAVRLRRDFGAVLNLIRAHAVLHQANRERDDGGRVVATFDDYATVRELVADLVSEGIEATVPKGVREAVHAVARLHADSSEPVTIAGVARELELDRSAASRRIKAAKEQSYLRDLEDNPRKPSRLVPGDSLPEDLEVLPRTEALKACTRAGEIGGRYTPLPPSNDEEGGGGGAYPSENGARLHAQASPDDGRVRFTI